MCSPRSSMVILLLISSRLAWGQPIEISADYSNVQVAEINPIIYGLSATVGVDFINSPMYRDLVAELGGTTLHLNSSASVGHWNMLTGDVQHYDTPMPGLSLADLKQFSDDCGGAVKYYLVVNWTVYASEALGGEGRDIGEVITWLQDSGWPLEYWQYWRLGSETYGEWDHEFIASGADYGEICVEIFTRMKELEPNIKTGISGEIVWKPGWSASALDVCGDLVDFVDYHQYPHDFGDDTLDQVYGVMGQEPFVRNALLPMFHNQIDQHAGGRPLEILFSEYDFWGMDAVGESPPYGRNTTLGTALAWGDQIGYALELGINLGGGYTFAGGGSYGMLMSWEDGEQIGRPAIYSPKVWAIGLWQKHFGTTMVHSTVNGSPSYVPTTGRPGWGNVDCCDWDGYTSYQAGAVPYVTAYAGLDAASSRASLIVINKHNSNPYELAITLDGVTINSGDDTDVYTLTTDDPKGLLAWQNRYNVSGGGDAQQVDPPTHSTLRVGNTFSFTIEPHAMVAISLPLGSQCSDGLDNDNDGQADYPNDSGCASPEDNDESNCGDGVCEGGESCATCADDCSCPSCGDGVCEGGESCATCADDCVCPSCIDGDADGYGDPASTVCTHPQRDCNDSDAAVHPGADEVCDDTVDNDCDGLTDDDDAECGATCEDADDDGFANAICGGDDCNDSDGEVHPDAVEVCNDGKDNDCNGFTDVADPICAQVCTDGDGDGFASTACGGDDCNDSDAEVHPDASEACDDGKDNDCNGLTDVSDQPCALDTEMTSNGCACSAGASSFGLPVLLVISFWRRRKLLG